MVDSEMFSALRVRRRLEDIARTIAEARVTGDVYASLDAVENGLLAVMDEVADLAQVLADAHVRAAADSRRGGWGRIFMPFRSPGPSSFG